MESSEWAMWTFLEAEKELYKRVTSGYSCNKHFEIIEMTAFGIVIHHKSHTEWMDRGFGSANCASWWGLWKGKYIDTHEYNMQKAMVFFEEGNGSKRRFYKRLEALKNTIRFC